MQIVMFNRSEIMPELPEMETYKSLLQLIIGGQSITEVMINREKSINVPIEEFASLVLHQKAIRAKMAPPQADQPMPNPFGGSTATSCDSKSVSECPRCCIC